MGAEQVDLSDRVLGSPLRPEPVGDRHEVGLEDRFQHQLQRCLDDPVRDRQGCPASGASPTRPAWESCVPAPAGAGTCPPSAGPAGRPGTRAPPPPRRRRPSRRPRPGVRTLVARDPVERHDQRRRVVHEVEQVIEPAARIGRRPTVKLGLHPRYPRPRPSGAGPRAPPFSGASCGITASFPSRYRCRPSPCDRLSRPRTTTAAPPRPDRSAVGAPIPGPGRMPAAGSGTRAVPVFTVIRSTKEEPGCVPAASPRVRRRPSPWPPGPASARPEVPRTTAGRTAPGPYPPGSSRCTFKGRKTPVPRVLLSIHARRTRTIWQYWHVPALSGLLPPSPAPPGSGCPQLHRPAATGRRRRSLTSTRINSASRRTPWP